MYYSSKGKERREKKKKKKRKCITFLIFNSTARSVPVYSISIRLWNYGPPYIMLHRHGVNFNLIEEQVHVQVLYNVRVRRNLARGIWGGGSQVL